MHRFPSQYFNEYTFRAHSCLFTFFVDNYESVKPLMFCFGLHYICVNKNMKLNKGDVHFRQDEKYGV